MQMMTLTIAMLVGFQIKHFVADYLLQPHWILRGKGDLRKLGGYIHALAHAVGSLPVLAIGGLDLASTLVLATAEFAVHYAIDHAKAGISIRSGSGPNSAAYWALHGADQLLHHLTYAAMIFAALLLGDPI